MKEEFYITIKDNFFDENIFKELHNTLPNLNYFCRHNAIVTDDATQHINHIWFSTDSEEHIQNIVKENCEKILNKKFKINFCSYTLLSTVEPLPHCDLDDKCDYQVIIYIKGNENLHKGTGFYVYNKDKDENQLNTHVGFKQNRAVLWHSNTTHTPMNWAADDKSKRFSVICQMKEIK